MSTVAAGRKSDGRMSTEDGTQVRVVYGTRPGDSTVAYFDGRSVVMSTSDVRALIKLLEVADDFL